MNMYRKYSRLMFLVGLLFVSGGQLFAAVANIGKLQDAVEKVEDDVLLKEAEWEEETDITAKAKLKKELDELKRQSRLAQLKLKRAQDQEKGASVKRAPVAAVETEQQTGAEEIPGTPTKEADIDRKSMNDPAVIAFVLKDSQEELKSLEDNPQKQSYRAGFFIEEGMDKRVKDEPFAKMAREIKAIADKDLPRTLYQDVVKIGSAVVGPVTNLLNGAVSGIATGAGWTGDKIGKIVGGAGAAASGALRYVFGSYASPGKI